MKVLIICDDISDEKIITPKSRCICPRKKILKEKYLPIIIILNLLLLKIPKIILTKNHQI